MPLTMVGIGNEVIVSRIAGKPEIKKHLENLGFVSGSKVKIIAEVQGDLIVNIKESRIAISKDMANKIII